MNGNQAKMLECGKFWPICNRNLRVRSDLQQNEAVTFTKHCHLNCIREYNMLTLPVLGMFDNLSMCILWHELFNTNTKKQLKCRFFSLNSPNLLTNNTPGAVCVARAGGWPAGWRGGSGRITSTGDGRWALTSFNC